MTDVFHLWTDSDIYYKKTSLSATSDCTDFVVLFVVLTQLLLCFTLERYPVIFGLAFFSWNLSRITHNLSNNLS